MKQTSDYQDIPMNRLCDELRLAAIRDHVLELGDVWDRYIELAEEIACAISQLFISRQHFSRIWSNVSVIIILFSGHSMEILQKGRHYLYHLLEV